MKQTKKPFEDKGISTKYNEGLDSQNLEIKLHKVHHSNILQMLNYV